MRMMNKPTLSDVFDINKIARALILGKNPIIEDGRIRLTLSKKQKTEICPDGEQPF